MLGLQAIEFIQNQTIVKIKLGDVSTIIYNNYNKEIGKDKMKDYLKRFLSIIDNWNQEYVDNQFIDGIDWKLILVYDQRIKEYKGYGRTPSNFPLLQELFYSMIESEK